MKLTKRKTSITSNLGNKTLVKLDTDTDILHMFLISSNTLVTYENIPSIKKKRKKLCFQTMSLLNNNIETQYSDDFKLDSSSSTENLKSDSNYCFDNIDNDNS